MEKERLPKFKLEEKLKELITKLDKQQIKKLNKEFLTKGMNPRTIQLLALGEKSIGDISDYEAIAILKSSGIDSSLYFTDIKIANYEALITIDQTIDTITIDNATKYSNILFRGSSSIANVVKYYKNQLFLYNYETQRASKIVATNFGDVKKMILNHNNINEMVEKIVADKLIIPEIIINVRHMDEKTPQMYFETDNGKNGKLIIRPNYEIESKNTTYVDIIDGMHRVLAYVKAYDKYIEETGLELEGEIPFCIVNVDVTRAKEIVDDTFKRTGTDINWTKSLENSDYSNFVDELIKTGALKDKVADTYEVAKDSSIYLTHKALLIDMTKKLNINVSGYNAIKNSESMKKTIGFLMDIISERQEKDYLLLPNMFAFYFCFANDMIGNLDYSKFDIFIDILVENMQEIKGLKITHKTCNLDKIIDFYNNLEVV